MTTLLNIVAAIVLGVGLLALVIAIAQTGYRYLDRQHNAYFAFGWSFGALAMLGLMRFL